MASDNPKRLYRSDEGKVVAGVCAGIGEYFDIDPVAIRILFVLFSLAGGSGVLLYIVMWLLIPMKGDETADLEANVRKGAEEMRVQAEKWAEKAKDSDGRKWLGIAIVGMGLLFLLSNLGLGGFVRMDLFWPVALVALGVIIIFRR